MAHTHLGEAAAVFLATIWLLCDGRKGTQKVVVLVGHGTRRGGANRQGKRRGRRRRGNKLFSLPLCHPLTKREDEEASPKEGEGAKKDFEVTNCDPFCPDCFFPPSFPTSSSSSSPNCFHFLLFSLLVPTTTTSEVGRLQKP